MIHKATRRRWRRWSWAAGGAKWRPLNQAGCIAPRRDSNRVALTAIYEKHRRRLLGHAVLQGATIEEAEDCVHEAIVSYLDRRATTPVIDVPSWLCRAVTNKLISLRRRESVRRRYEARYLITSSPRGCQDLPTSNFWDDAAQVTALISLCPPTQAAILAMFVDELSPREIGERLGKTPATIRKNLQLARDRLKEVLKDDPAVIGRRRRRHGK